MQLRQLEYFVALAEARHFTRAAETVGVAQPTLSHQIAVLERDLGAPLVIRRPANIELTATGAELLPIARRLLAEADNARRAVAEVAELRRGRVRLGATPSLCTGVVPAVLADYHRAHPDVAIIIVEGGSRDLQQRLVDGELDLALLIDSRSQGQEGLDTEVLFVEELVVISSPARWAPTRRRVPLAELRRRQLVMFRAGYDLRDSTLAACRAAGFEPRLAVEGGEMDAVLSLVAAGVGVAVVPASVTAGDDRFRVTRIGAPGLERTVELARRSGVPLAPAADELARRLAALPAPSVR